MIEVGDIVQVVVQDNDLPPMLGTLHTVDEVKSWGVQTYVAIPCQEGLAYFRLPNGTFEVVGHAVLQTTGDERNE